MTFTKQDDSGHQLEAQLGGSQTGFSAVGSRRTRLAQAEAGRKDCLPGGGQGWGSERGMVKPQGLPPAAALATWPEGAGKGWTGCQAHRALAQRRARGAGRTQPLPSPPPLQGGSTGRVHTLTSLSSAGASPTPCWAHRTQRAREAKGSSLRSTTREGSPSLPGAPALTYLLVTKGSCLLSPRPGAHPLHQRARPLEGEQRVHKLHTNRTGL